MDDTTYEPIRMALVDLVTALPWVVEVADDYGAIILLPSDERYAVAIDYLDGTVATYVNGATDPVGRSRLSVSERRTDPAALALALVDLAVRSLIIGKRLADQH